MTRANTLEEPLVCPAPAAVELSGKAFVMVTSNHRGLFGAATAFVAHQTIALGRHHK